MRLIDAYSAKEAIEYTLVGDAASMAERVIDSQPTVDAVPVVRCRECKHRKYDDIFGMIWCNLDSYTKRVKSDDFCSRGERKEGADNG